MNDSPIVSNNSKPDGDRNDHKVVYSRIQAKLKVDKEHAGSKLFDFLAITVKPVVSKAVWKKCIEAGGVWQRIGKQKKRLKRVTGLVQEGDQIEVYFDPHILEKNEVNLSIEKVYHKNNISCWLKPNNILTQDSPYGDQQSLYSYVSKLIRPTFLIHRLDRETDGLVLFAHSKEMAALCNKVFAEHKIQKYYFALVIKKEAIENQTVTFNVDQKNAVTEVEMPTELELIKLYEKFPETKDLQATWVKLLPITGRKHQLRIHMQHLGRPLLHDPRYSRTHKKGTRLYLIAYAIKSEVLGIDCNIFTS